MEPERSVLRAENGGNGDFGSNPYRDTSIAQPGWTKLLILAGFSTTIGSSLCVGFHIGVVNSPAQIIKQFLNHTISDKYNSNITSTNLNLLWSCIVSIFLVGGATGSLGGSVLADKVGRKRSILISTILSLLGAILFVLTKTFSSIECILLARLLVGLSSGLITTVMPMYLTELSPINLRGSVGVLCPLGVTTGVLVGQILSVYELLGNESSWHLLLAAYLIPLLVGTLIYPLLPESPKYLYIIRERHQEGLDVLCKVRNCGLGQLDAEIRDLKRENEDNCAKDSVWTIGKVLKDRKLLLPLLLVTGLQAGQQFSGINAVFYYSSTIFESAGLSRQSSELATIGAGCCNLLMAILSIKTMAAFSRRSVLKLSLTTTAFFLILLGIATTFIHSFTWMPYISIVGVLGFVVCYGIALGPIPYFVGSELFEVGPRPSAMALGSMANWTGNFCVGLLFPTMQQTIGASSFYIFAAIVLLLHLFTRMYLPETRGRDPSQVAHFVQNGLNRNNLNTSSTKNMELEALKT